MAGQVDELSATTGPATRACTHSSTMSETPRGCAGQAMEELCCYGKCARVALTLCRRHKRLHTSAGSSASRWPAYTPRQHQPDVRVEAIRVALTAVAGCWMQ